MYIHALLFRSSIFSWYTSEKAPCHYFFIYLALSVYQLMEAEAEFMNVQFR
jgi:hypothetical protein